MPKVVLNVIILFISMEEFAKFVQMTLLNMRQDIAIVVQDIPQTAYIHAFLVQLIAVIVIMIK
jgi:hypothetical protein